MDYYQSHYSPSNTIVCVAGAISEKKVEKDVKNYFKDLKDKKYGQKILSTIEEDKYSNIEDLSLDDLELLKNKNVVGLDPGKANLVFMMDEKGNKLRYTAPQRRIESKSKCNHYIMLKEKKKNNDVQIIQLIHFSDSNVVIFTSTSHIIQFQFQLNPF